MSIPKPEYMDRMVHEAEHLRGELENFLTQSGDTDFTTDSPLGKLLRAQHIENILDETRFFIHTGKDYDARKSLDYIKEILDTKF